MSRAQVRCLISVAVAVVVALLLMPSFKASTIVVKGSFTPQRPAQSRRVSKRVGSAKARIDYSRFSHNTHVAAQKLACDSCHKFPTPNWQEVRKGDAAFPDVAEFPQHETCLNCHRQQFFARERPAPAICSNCHVNVTPRDTTRFLFDSLGDVSDSSKPRRDMVPEFAVNFPHDKHLDVVGSALPRRGSRSPFVTVVWQEKTQPEASEIKSCPVCHQTYQPQGDSDEEYATKPPKDLGDNFWLKKGTFKTIPNSHAACFTCHNTDAGIEPLPSNCGTCHKLTISQSSQKTDFDPQLAKTMGVTSKAILTAWPRRESSGTYRHEGGEHPNMSCLKCHNVPAMNTTDRKSLVVPVVSCGGAEGCHITATTDDGGILNYEIDQKKADASFVCTKCHISLGKEALPETHVRALQAVKKP
jgi:Cytochrome c7 and related cytochrome c